MDYHATILFTISLNSPKVWNRGFHWPVFGVGMHRKSPNVHFFFCFNHESLHVRYVNGITLSRVLRKKILSVEILANNKCFFFQWCHFSVYSWNTVRYGCQKYGAYIYVPITSSDLLSKCLSWMKILIKLCSNRIEQSYSEHFSEIKTTEIWWVLVVCKSFNFNTLIVINCSDTSIVLFCITPPHESRFITIRQIQYIKFLQEQNRKTRSHVQCWKWSLTSNESICYQSS